MMGNGPPGWYWKIMWCVVSPLCMAILFGASLVKLFIDNPTYEVYVTETGETFKILFRFKSALFSFPTPVFPLFK